MQCFHAASGGAVARPASAAAAAAAAAAEAAAAASHRYNSAWASRRTTCSLSVVADVTVPFRLVV